MIRQSRGKLSDSKGVILRKVEPETKVQPKIRKDSLLILMHSITCNHIKAYLIISNNII